MRTRAKADDRAVPSFRHGQIEAVLSRVRPFLQADGVDVELIDVRDNGASVRLTGLCPECASAPLSMHTGLVELLRDEIPTFGDLRLVLDANHGSDASRDVCTARTGLTDGNWDFRLTEDVAHAHRCRHEGQRVK